MPRTKISKRVLAEMIEEYTVQELGLAVIAAKRDMSRGTVRTALANSGVPIRSKTEKLAKARAMRMGSKVKVVNLPKMTPATSTPNLLKYLLAGGHVSQADIDELATAQAATPAAPTTPSSFADMSKLEKERAGLKAIISILDQTTTVGRTQKQLADLFGRSGSWVSNIVING